MWWLCDFRYRDRYLHEHEHALQNVEAYLANPINAFVLIKMLTVDLEDLQAIDEGKFDIFLQKVFRKSYYLIRDKVCAKSTSFVLLGVVEVLRERLYIWQHMTSLILIALYLSNVDIQDTNPPPVYILILASRFSREQLQI